jgi:drug/metabolite transporter superfamily protein YnfA
MKRVLSLLLQLVLLLLVYAAGCVLPVFHVLPALQWNGAAGRVFVYDGLLLMLALYLLLLVAAALRRRLRSSGVTSTGAVMLALVLLLLTRFPLAWLTVGS